LFIALNILNDAYTCKWVVYEVDFIKWNFIRAQNALIDEFENVLEIILGQRTIYLKALRYLD
jgi:hypothetical protein